MEILPLVLDAMLSLSAPDPNRAERARLAAIAAAIASESARAPLWPGDEGRLATALALVAIGQHESRFAEGVRRCKQRGRYVGMFQIAFGDNLAPYAPRAVCASDRLQAELALRHLHATRESCGRCAPGALFRAFSSGSAQVDSPEAREAVSIWVRAARREGLQVVPHGTEPPRWSSRPAAAPSVAARRP